MASLMPTKTTDAQVRQAELLTIAAAAREYLDVYGKHVHGYQAAPHHMVWIRKAMAVIDGVTDEGEPVENRKLLIIAPPGTAKSTWLSQILVTWFLGKHPDKHLMFFTSSDPMAQLFDGFVELTLAQNTKHAEVFPQAEARPNTDRGWSGDGRFLMGSPMNQKDPAYRAVGFGTSIIGGRADAIILDDPMTQEGASSEIEQAKARAYFDATINTRLHPTEGWCIAIMTRWHQADLAAYLSDPTKGGFDTVVMPALALSSDGDTYPWGESVWPERLPVEFLKKERRRNPAWFETTYQGDPTSLGGSVFKKRSWFKPLPDDFRRPGPNGIPSYFSLACVQFYDLAYSGKKGADWTVGGTGRVDADGCVFLTDVWRRHIEAQDDDDEDDAYGLAGQIARNIGRHRPIIAGIPLDAYRTAYCQNLIARVGRILRHMGVSTRVTGVKQDKDKVVRAQLPAGIAENGDFYVDHTAEWYEPYVRELLGFPLMKNDDQVDMTSGLCQLALENVDFLGHETTGYGFKADEPRDEAEGSWTPFDEHEQAVVVEKRVLAAATGGAYR
jgi:phage terminase large subunit-like protein